MTVYAYLFLSADKEHLVSLADQQQRITAFGADRGLKVAQMIVEEGVSLKRPFGDRPQGRSLLQALAPRDVVVVLRAEWILASAREGIRLLDGLRKRHVSLYCVDLEGDISLPAERRLVVSEGSSGLIRKLLASLSICENSSHGEAIRATKRLRKRQGKHSGGPVPFGWRLDQEGFLRQHPQQQVVIETIASLRREGVSYREIAGRLETELGIGLSHEGVRRLLVNNQARKDQEQVRTGQE